MHDELFTKLFLMLHQIGVEEILVRVVLAYHLLHDGGVKLIANVIEVIGFVLIANFAHSNSPSFFDDVGVDETSAEVTGAMSMYSDGGVGICEKTMPCFVTKSYCCDFFS